MPSHLRLEQSFDAVDAQATYQTSPTLPPAKKQKMSLTQTYYVASTARTKLGREAGRADHNLRRLVGHANLLDTLMVELADAEREQEAWFNESVKGASKQQTPAHLQWFDTIEEEDDEDSSDDESDDGSSVYDEEEEDGDDYYVPLRKMRSPPVEFSSIEIDEEYDSDDDDMEMEPLTRVSSRHSPPELTHDDSDSDEEPMPPSPENSTLDYSDKERQAITTTTFYDHRSRQQIEELFPQQPQAPAIAAC
ncbi:hypothetical protein K431DRAFT_281519 [Polychaeton citri CBS 116435]|uniref:Uncharacterized protein n=1 Tax=Polychaeton citri CBS 116435 TaxID=1314669 RepID=A0A9P4QG83_9PEZI|nr:hypothetical protein K431DRAFT_281519 [Polychaeton citri CBS 116435]